MDTLITPASVEAFLAHARADGTPENTLRRLAAAANSLYAFLPEADKTLTRDRLLGWRADLESRGYSPVTIQNYVKYINKYLDYVGCSAIRFRQGRAKDITGMTFGYLTALSPTDKRDRKDVVWLCQCRCGQTVELPATRLLRNNTLSCGCIKKEQLNRANMYFAETGLRQSLEDKPISTANQSGYVGVVQKRGKWQAQITYRKKHYILGTYTHLDDAVKARARAKELVMENAAELQELYNLLHESDESLPGRLTTPKQDVAPPPPPQAESDTPARRSDNTSGYTGVSYRKNKWEAKLCYQGTRYLLGRFDQKEDAAAERRRAEILLAEDPRGFVEKYGAGVRQSG